MIVTRVRELALARGYKNANQLAKALGVAANAGVRLWSDDFSRIDLPTLNKLCRVLRCQPGRLIKYQPDTKVGSRQLAKRGRRESLRNIAR